ncbi:MAG: acetylglutamate kinase [Candidatus Latescibacteria bacterium]|nr:acetylglutamate kinase [Candidatus Latescibacterota bacterium]
MTDLQVYIDKAATLIEAMPYIQDFRGKTVVIKYGGSTMMDKGEIDPVLQDIVFMESVGMKPVIVHGGGPAIDQRLQELKIESKRVNGLRVTDKATMQVVEEVLFGVINAGIVETVHQLGARVVGVSAKESGVMHVRKHFAQTPEGKVDLGFVGEVTRIDATPLLELIQEGTIPVVAPIGRGVRGGSYNVNADTAAGAIAAALHAEKLVFLTDVKGIMRDSADEQSLLSTIHVREVDDLVSASVIKGGMIPKVGACVQAVKAGVRKTHIIDGRIPHSMLLEFFTNEGIGTQIVQ